MNKISIIIPLYNEFSRLKYLFKEINNFHKKRKNRRYEIIFVNDGSTDLTLDRIQDFKRKKRNKFLKIITYKNNYGKGYALQKGVAAAKYEWVLTFDADVSVKILCFMKYKKYYTFNKKFAYFADRSHFLSKTSTTFLRSFVGNILNNIVFIFLKKKIPEFQCGYKIYHKSYIKKIFKQIVCKTYAHDFELLFLLKQNSIEIKNCPVKWKHRSEGKVNIFIDSLIYFFWLLRIVKKFNFKY